MSAWHDRRVQGLVAQALARLRAAGVRLDPGLSDREMAQIQERLNFVFGPEHREFLQSALPIGEPSWPDWRNGATEDLQGRLDWPVDGVVFDCSTMGSGHPRGKKGPASLPSEKTSPVPISLGYHDWCRSTPIAI
jgi:hypothetical protein